MVYNVSTFCHRSTVLNHTSNLGRPSRPWASSERRTLNEANSCWGTGFVFFARAACTTRGAGRGHSGCERVLLLKSIKWPREAFSLHCWATRDRWAAFAFTRNLQLTRHVTKNHGHGRQIAVCFIKWNTVEFSLLKRPWLMLLKFHCYSRRQCIQKLVRK